MARTEFTHVGILPATKRDVIRLRKMLQRERGGIRRLPNYEAVHVAVTEAIERRRTDRKQNPPVEG